MNIPSMGQIIPHWAETNTAYALELQAHGRSTDIDRPITTRTWLPTLLVSWTR
jgi:hypothetical protein